METEENVIQESYSKLNETFSEDDFVYEQKVLVAKSRKPHYHPKQHTLEEIELIKRYKANNKKTGLVVLWVKLSKAGYTRTVQGLYGVMKRMEIMKKHQAKRKNMKQNHISK